MINYQQLTALAPVWATLSRLIDYPQPDTFSATNRATLATAPQIPDPVRTQALACFDQLARGSRLEQEQHFADLFELNRRYTLYMTYYKMSDSRERGTVLAKLKMLYEMFGVSEVSDELADFLPLMLEFFAYGDFLNDQRQADLSLALGVIEDGTYGLLQRASVDSEDPYIQCITVGQSFSGWSTRTRCSSPFSLEPQSGSINTGGQLPLSPVKSLKSDS